MAYLTKTFVIIFFAAYLALALLVVGTVVPFAGYQVRLVATGSMAPTMPIGTAVFIKKSAHYTVGEVVTFRHPGEKLPTTHRIISDEAQAGVIYYTTKGDANSAPDQRPTAESDAIGRVWLAVPYLGYVLDFVRKPLGFLLIIGVPLALVVVDEFGKVRVKKVRQKQIPPATPV